MMLVTNNNSFDLWQKDVFFSAAEEVQQSVDIMESMYRMWLRGGREGQELDYSVDLHGELQMALGTAKWQLEEFERAARLSHGYRLGTIQQTAARGNLLMPWKIKYLELKKP
ncbi:hypothetical protein IFM89_026091 [Coptis chinensis]|uniref:Syntaxin 6/10/61 N-terminal domain-containing protein n=1 Tax=Coptis chinensis TaxID=261450 RepID=A0A835HFI8_9MAGN|nr:hypothetical protein IFM89_026091 [Coptis chinensis]